MELLFKVLVYLAFAGALASLIAGAVFYARTLRTLSADVQVTFAPSGRATTAIVNGALAGTRTGVCVATMLRGAQVPAFDGGAVTVHKNVLIH